MYIEKIISYKGAWELAENEFSDQFKEVNGLIQHFIDTCETPIRSYHASREFKSLLQESGWQDVKRLQVGPVKNGVSVDMAMVNSAYLNRWIFHNSVVAIRRGIVGLPILIIPSSSNSMFERMLGIYSFEHFESQLEQISPLSHQHPFLILGFSNNVREEKSKIRELESDPLVSEANHIIDRFIEFPPEYHQAGLGILNYFGTYLREQYPDEEAKVKIIQEGLKVRMIIETMDGRSEMIEKALHEYQLIVTGQSRPENITDNVSLILGLRSELRIAAVRIADQQDIIGLQNAQIRDQGLQIKELYGIIGNGLINRTPVIDFKPTITIQNSIQFNPEISLALGGIAELKDLLPQGSEAHTTLIEIEGSLEAIEKEKDPEKVKKSPAMSKFRRFIEKVAEGNNDVKKAIDTVEQGWDIFKDLAGKYNSIAEWCGLPQVPKVFTK